MGLNKFITYKCGLETGSKGARWPKRAVGAPTPLGMTDRWQSGRWWQHLKYLWKWGDGRARSRYTEGRCASSWQSTYSQVQGGSREWVWEGNPQLVHLYRISGQSLEFAFGKWGLSQSESDCNSDLLHPKVTWICCRSERSELAGAPGPLWSESGSCLMSNRWCIQSDLTPSCWHFRATWTQVIDISRATWPWVVDKLLMCSEQPDPESLTHQDQFAFSIHIYLNTFSCLIDTTLQLIKYK